MIYDKVMVAEKCFLYIQNKILIMPYLTKLNYPISNYKIKHKRYIIAKLELRLTQLTPHLLLLILTVLICFSY